MGEQIKMSPENVRGKIDELKNLSVELADALPVDKLPFGAAFNTSGPAGDASHEMNGVYSTLAKELADLLDVTIRVLEASVDEFVKLDRDAADGYGKKAGA